MSDHGEVRYLTSRYLNTNTLLLVLDRPDTLRTGALEVPYLSPELN
jgi:hypothetical protein